MRLEVVKKTPNCRVLSTDGEVLRAARGNRFFELDAQGMRRDIGSVGSLWERALARSRLLRQLLRLGIHHLLRLPDGRFLVVVRKRTYLVGASGEARIAFRFERGNKPASKGVCVAPGGDIFIAEYAVNGARKLPMMLHRSRDGGKSFETIHEFGPGEVCHYHFVQWDRYENCLWMGTGDADRECLLYRSDDGGDNWRQVGGGSQLWRAVGLAFRQEAVYWGTDAGWTAGTHPNYVMRLDRSTGEVEKVLEIQGPCHGSAALRDGTLLISTGVERGKNEKDGYAHLWASRDGRAWEELIRFKKDLWFRNLQFGVIRFPQGLENSDSVAFTCMALAGAGEAAFVARITDD
jgi:hypothetical protein